MICLLTVVTVFLGIRLPDASLDDSALYAMIVYCVGVAIVIAFDVFLSFKKDVRSASFSPAGGEKDAGELGRYKIHFKTAYSCPAVCSRLTFIYGCLLADSISPCSLLAVSMLCYHEVSAVRTLLIS